MAGLFVAGALKLLKALAVNFALVAYAQQINIILVFAAVMILEKTEILVNALAGFVRGNDNGAYFPLHRQAGNFMADNVPLLADDTRRLRNFGPAVFRSVGFKGLQNAGFQFSIVHARFRQAHFFVVRVYGSSGYV